MLGRLFNGKAHQDRRPMVNLPEAQRAAVDVIANRAAALIGTPSSQLIKMHIVAVRAAYAASDETEQLEQLLEAAAITVALSSRLVN